MESATSTGGNVSILDERRAKNEPVTRAQSLMAHCRTELREQIGAAIRTIMDEVDDALFELSEKADSNQVQSVYFEAMRSVRLCREAIEARFLSELDTAIDQRMKARIGSDAAPGLLPLDASSFSLLAQEDLEESVAVKNIVTKIRNVCHEDLFALDRRVALLLGEPTIEGDDNPIGPAVLANAARGAVSVIESSLEIRLLVLKLVDRQLTRAAQRYYAAVNGWLANQGVFPDLRAGTPAPVTRAHRARRTTGAGTPRAAPRREARQAPVRIAGKGEPHGWAYYHGGSHAPAGESAGPAPADAAFFGGGAPAAGAGPGAGFAGGASGEGVPLPGGPRREQMLGVLDQVMRVGGADDLDGAGPERDQFIGSLTDLQRDATMHAGDHGNAVRALKAGGAASRVSHVDSLMVDVVAMMFDFILEDENIADAVRCLIGRLQIPVLKVAILDKSFFARRSHPARSFVNRLADFGARAAATEDGPVWDGVRTLVARILDEFDTQVDMFSAALQELETLIAGDDDEASRNAWTASKVAQERQRLADARRLAGQEVASRLDGVDAPPAVTEFLESHWRHVLGERLFVGGEQSEAWRAGIVVMDRLLWSVGPKREAVERDRLLEMLPLLLEQLKLGMNEVGLPADARSVFLRALSDLHISSLRGDAPVPAAPGAGSDEPVPGATESTAAAIPEDAPGARAARILREAVEHANAMVFTTASERAQCEGMGTTVVAVKLEGDRLACAHAGDSRLYRLRAGALEQITRDHTYRQDVIDRGLASEADAAGIASNLITRAVGGGATIQVAVHVHETAPGDLYLACSDGLNDMIDDDHIARILAAEPGAADLDALAGALVDAANAAGGHDNVTVALLRVDDSLPEGGEARDYGAFVSLHAASDPGRRRAHNEDTVHVDAALGLLVLADGMGGHNAGEVASAMTARLVTEAFVAAPESVTEAAPVAAASDAAFDFAAINAELWEDAVADPGNRALHEAVAMEVESIVLASEDDLDALFDIDSDAGQMPATVSRDAERDPLLERVLKLVPGTWVEFGERAGRGSRARLSWVAPGQRRFLFTDRFGQKVSESTPYGLALELRRGRMRVLNAIPLLDRAVSKVSDRLRSTQPLSMSTA